MRSPIFYLGIRGAEWLKVVLIFSAMAIAGLATPALAFIHRQRWEETASGNTGSQGNVATLTWSIVPDGTPIAGVGTSGLRQFLDGTFGIGDGSADLTQRPWFPILESSLGRWGELSGLTFQFEPDDDGAMHSDLHGQLGVRGDIRFAGASLDGFNNTLALSSYPNNGDILLDTDDVPLFSNPASNYLRFRNVLMHELGHSLGFEHVDSNNAAFLMESSLNLSFDGPQLDEIRAVHWYYGDANEKSNGGLGNGTYELATDLGLITIGGSTAVGADAGPDLVVAATDTDFVSIHNGQDADYYSIRVAQPSLLNAVLTPRGGIYNQGSQGGQQSPIDANSRSDLAFAIFDSDGTTLLRHVNRDGAGTTESLSELLLPSAGTYYIRVTGASSQVQLYQLDLSVTSTALTIAGDYNRDGAVDAGDFTVWRDSLGQTGANLIADGNGDEVVNHLDYGIWKANFGLAGSGGSALAAQSIPEPSIGALLGAFTWIASIVVRQRESTIRC